MNEKNSTSKFDFRLAVVLIIYTILGLFLIKYYRYQINPDGISYISIAQKYLNGDFSNAINRYWAPLLSWLLMPFLYFGVEPLLAAKLLSLAIGLATITGLRVLSRRFEMTESIRLVILAAAVPVVLSVAFYCITPDLLLTCILLFYLAVIFGGGYGERKGAGIVCGVVGGAAYLSKSFAFPFFISHFFLMNALHFLRSETGEAKKNIVHNFLAGAIIFALISGVWIGLLTNKYGELTFGASGRMAVRGFTAPGAKGAPVLWQGFFEPSNESAISVWEDPSYLEMPPYNPFGSWSNLKHQLKVIAKNIGEMAGIFMDFSLLSIAIGLGYVLFWLRRFNIRAMRGEVLYPTVTIALYVGGYSMVLVRDRYLWVIFMLLMLMGGHVVGRLFESNFFTRARRAALLAILFLLFAVPASEKLRSQVNVKKYVYVLSEVLKNRISPDCNIASNTEWSMSLYLAYYLDCKYYGAQKKGISKIELKRQLERYGIDYYFVWGGAAGDFSFLSNYQDITGGRIGGLRIYGLKMRR